MEHQNISVQSNEHIKIQIINILEIRKLRALILRPDQTPETMAFVGDYAPDTLHLGAFNQRKLVGIVTIIHQAPPNFTGISPDQIWLLRGMATLPEVRGQGYGAALIRTACAYVASERGTGLWCNARESAAGFYKKLGFAIKGNRFDIVPTGLHYRMWREITLADSRYEHF